MRAIFFFASYVIFSGKWPSPPPPPPVRLNGHRPPLPPAPLPPLKGWNISTRGRCVPPGDPFVDRTTYDRYTPIMYTNAYATATDLPPGRTIMRGWN